MQLKFPKSSEIAGSLKGLKENLQLWGLIMINREKRNYFSKKCTSGKCGPMG